MTNETNIDKAKSEKESSRIVNLFNEKRQSSPSALESINLINHKYVSVRTTNGKQIAHLDMAKGDSGKEKLEKLFSQLRKMCIRDANYWVELPTGSWIRKNAILGFQCADGVHQGVILRAHNNRILSFIPCVGAETKLRIIQEIKLAIAERAPSRRYQPTWDFYQEQVA